MERSISSIISPVIDFLTHPPTKSISLSAEWSLIELKIFFIFGSFFKFCNLFEELMLFLVKIFKNFGLSNNHALISANAIINAELVGAYGHGLSRLKMYCDRISKKLINPKPKIKIKKISQSISYIDARTYETETKV